MNNASATRVGTTKAVMGLVNTAPGTDEKFVCVKLSLDGGVTKSFVADIIADMLFVGYVHKVENKLYPGTAPEGSVPEAEQVKE